MKKFSLLLLICSTFLLQGCFNVIEDIHLNKKGSGTYQITYDLSSIISNPMLKEMIKQSAEEGDESMSGLFSGGEMELDTLIALKDSPMSEGKEMPEVLKKATMAMKISESKGQFETVMKFDFKNVGEIAEFYTALGDISEEGQAGFGGMLPSLGLFETKKKSITRKSFDLTNLKEQMGGEESMDMMKMMMSGATYKTIYHLPKKAKNTNIEGAKMDGKTVTVTHDYLDIIEGTANLAGTIKF